MLGRILAARHGLGSGIEGGNPRREHSTARTRHAIRCRTSTHPHQLAIHHYVFNLSVFGPVEPQVLEEHITHGRS
jgi:hypothetical protein